MSYRLNEKNIYIDNNDMNISNNKKYLKKKKRKKKKKKK